MSFRDVNQTGLDVVRQMKDDIDQNERDTGSVRQNTIRLGQWVIGANGAVITFTNTVTGKQHFFGGREEWSYSDVVIIDENTDGAWVHPPYDIKLHTLTLTLQKSSSDLIAVQTMVNGAAVGAPGIIHPGQEVGTIALDINVGVNDKYWPQIRPTEGDGEMLGIVYDYSLQSFGALPQGELIDIGMVLEQLPV